MTAPVHACAGAACRVCGLVARNRGMTQAAAAAPTWAEAAMDWIRAQPDGARFTSEDLTAAIGLPTGTIGQHRNNATGAIMAAAHRAGLVRRVGYVESVRRSSHAAVLSRWERYAPNPATAGGALW